MRLLLALAAGIVTTLPVQAQIVGQTCGPTSCNLILAAPEPAVIPMIDSVSAHCGELKVDLYLLNDTRFNLFNFQKWSDTSLHIDSLWLHPELITSHHQEVVSGSFIGPVRYTAAIPRKLRGPGKLKIGYLQEVTFNVDTDNPCMPETKQSTDTDRARKTSPHL